MLASSRTPIQHHSGDDPDLMIKVCHPQFSVVFLCPSVRVCPEVTVTSLHPPRLCRIAVLLVKPIVFLRATKMSRTSGTGAPKDLATHGRSVAKLFATSTYTEPCALCLHCVPVNARTSNVLRLRRVFYRPPCVEPPEAATECTCLLARSRSRVPCLETS